MDMKINQQVALDEALVPHASRLRIGKSNFRLRSDIISKEYTLQLTKSFLQGVSGHRRCSRDIQAGILGNCHNEILAFLRFLGHSGEIRKLTDVNINKLHQPWRSFTTVINKFLSEKNFLYQVEHKDAKKSNEMYYPRFTKVIIHYFMTKDPSIPRRNKVNWHYVKDDQMFTTIKLVLRHQNTQQFTVMLHVELTNKDIRNSKAYKEYYAVASGAAPPKTKSSVMRTKSSSDTTITPPTAAGTRLSTSTKGKQHAKASKAKSLIVLFKVAMTEKLSDEDDDDDVDERNDDQDDDDDQDEGNDDASLGLNVVSEEGQDAEDDEDELYRDVNINLEGRDVQMTYVHTTQEFEDTHVTLTPVNPDGQQQSSIKRYIDTKPNHELINYCLKNPPYKFTWADKEVSVTECSSVTTTKKYMKNYKNVLQDIRDQLNTEAEASQELKTVSYHKLYDIQKQHQNEVNELRAERIARTTNPLHLFLNNNQFTILRIILLTTLKIPQPDHNKLLPGTEEKGTGYDNQRIGNVDGAREIVGTTMVQKSRIQCYNCKEFRHVARECQKPKRAKDAAYHREKMLLYAANNFRPIFDSDPLQKNDDDDDLANERDLHASLIEKLKCEIDDSKNHNKFLETSNKLLVDKLKEINELMHNDLKKFQAELDRRNDVKYASKMKIDCAKAKGDLMSYKMESEKSFNAYTQKINDLNQKISKIKKELFAHQETISILSQAKEAQIKLYKTREDKELDKVIALENKVKVLDNIVYKTGQSVQTMNMLNNKCKTSFEKPEFLKKAQRENPRLYDIGFYNDNLALMLAPESDEVIRLEKESRS
nr:hypothetical protein [Tanacetum cinerariifolium]